MFQGSFPWKIYLCNVKRSMMLLKLRDNIGYIKGRKVSVCVQEEGRRVGIDLSSWVIWKLIYFSVPGEWALQLVIHDCLILSTFVSLMEQRAILFWSRKLLCVGCSVKWGIIYFQWLNDAMTVTFTGETATDVPVCKLYKSCLLYTFVVLCCTVSKLVLNIILLHLVK